MSLWDLWSGKFSCPTVIQLYFQLSRAVGQSLMSIPVHAVNHRYHHDHGLAINSNICSISCLTKCTIWVP